MRSLLFLGCFLLLTIILFSRGCSGCNLGCSSKTGSSPVATTTKEQPASKPADEKNASAKPDTDSVVVNLGSVEVGNLQFSVIGACTKTATCKVAVSIGSVTVVKGVATISTFNVQSNAPRLSSLCPGQDSRQNELNSFLNDYVRQDAEILAYARSAVWRALSEKPGVGEGLLINFPSDFQTKKSDVIAAPQGPFEMLDEFKL